MFGRNIASPNDQMTKSWSGSDSLGSDRSGAIFWVFIILHLSLWTLVPFVVYSNIPLDSVELHYWGQQWEWGYHKHPPLPAWATRAMTVAAGGSPIAVYLAAQLCMAAAFGAAWTLGRELISTQGALLAVALLECCYYYNFEATIFNNNTLLYPLWAWAVVCLYFALRTGRMRHWLGLGGCMGLGFLTKYSMGMLALPMFVFLIVHPQARNVWRRPGPYVAAAVALTIIAPHLHWAAAHGFPALHYAAQRTEHTGGIAGHALNPLRFLAAQALALLPVLAVALPITGRRLTPRPIASTERFARDFLIACVLGPFALHMLLSMALNLKLRSMWGCYLWTFGPLLLLFLLNLRLEAECRRRVLVGCAVMGLLLAAAIVVRVKGGGHAGRSHRELFPGRALASAVESIWTRECSGPLPVVAGEGWLAGNVAFYGPSGATVYGAIGELLPPETPVRCGWIDDRRLAQIGGIYLWSEDQPAKVPAAMRARFPNIQMVGTLTISYPMAAIPLERVGVAVIKADALGARSAQAEVRAASRG